MSLLNYFDEKPKGSSRKRKLDPEATESSSSPATKRRKNGDAEEKEAGNTEAASGRYVSSESDDESAGKENKPAKRKRKARPEAEEGEEEREEEEKDEAGAKETGVDDEGAGKEGDKPTEPVTYKSCHTLLEESWGEKLKNEFKKAYFKQLQKNLAKEEKSGATIYPPVHQVFRAFELCPWDDLKVVILGQDPYHDVGQAEGLAFSVPEGIKLPSSLRNIFKEAASDVDLKAPGHGSLVKWGEQGVLLLNSVLTVRAHKANSHSKYGWQEFTDAVIRAVSRHHDGVVFVLWGKLAQKKKKMINASKHRFVESPHPSGLSAHRGFFGSKCFSKTNAYLKELGKEPVDWQLHKTKA